MGRMKEIYMEMIERDYNGDHDAHIQELARQTCEEFIHVEDEYCGNCENHAIMRNETEAICEGCGQEYVYVNGVKRFR